MDAITYAAYLIEMQRSYESGETSIPVQASELELLKHIIEADLKAKEKK